MRDKVGNSEWDANVTPPIKSSPYCIGCIYLTFPHGVILNVSINDLKRQESHLVNGWDDHQRNPNNNSWATN